MSGPLRPEYAPQTVAQFRYALGAQYLNLRETTLNESPGLFFIESIYFVQTRLSADLVAD